MIYFQNTLIYLKSFLFSGFFFLIGNLLGSLPLATIFFGFLYKGGDTDFFGGLVLFSISSLMMTGVVMLFDGLIIRFLLKMNPRRRVYFMFGLIFGIILGMLVLFG